jgi:hypothetical protein
MQILLPSSLLTDAQSTEFDLLDLGGPGDWLDDSGIDFSDLGAPELSCRQVFLPLLFTHLPPVSRKIHPPTHRTNGRMRALLRIV